jgi:purine-binding chemotaxis protein CheW
MATELSALTRTSVAPDSRPWSDDSQFCAVLRLGRAAIAISLTAMREVVSHPAEFIELPVVLPGLLGAVDVRGLIVPVFDLRTHLGLDRAETGTESIVLVSDGRRVAGILVDDLHSVIAVNAVDLMPIKTQGADLMISHTFWHPDASIPISVLDILQILDLPGVLSTDVTSGSAQSLSGAGSAGDSAILTMLRCGEFMLALDVADVHTTLPVSQTRASVLSSLVCRGVMDFGGQEIAVIDPLALLGLGTLPTDERGPGVVLEVGGHFVTLAVTELVTITQVKRSEIMPAPRVALGRPELIAGVADLASVGKALVLDGAAIRHDERAQPGH